MPDQNCKECAKKECRSKSIHSHLEFDGGYCHGHQNEATADYPLGGTVEPYDVERDAKLT